MRTDGRPIAPNCNLSDEARRQPDFSPGSGRRWFWAVRVAAYGFAGVAFLAMAFVATVMIARRHPNPPGQVGTSGEAGRPPVSVPAAGPSARSPQDSLSADKVRELQRQLQFETSVLAALGDKVDQAQQELAALQQQKTVLRSSVADLQRQQEAARAAPGKQPSQQDPQPQPARADLTLMPGVQATDDWVVTRHGANVRAAPKKDAAVQRTVPRGVILRVYGRSRDGWVQVGEDDAWGWVYSSLLDPAP